MKIKLLMITILILGAFGIAQAVDSIYVSLYDVTRGRVLDPVNDTVYFNSSAPGTNLYQWWISMENDVKLVSMTNGYEIYTPDHPGLTMNLTDLGFFGASGACEAVNGSRMNPDGDTVCWDFGNTLLIRETSVNNGLTDSIMFGGQAGVKGLTAGPMEHMLSIHFSLSGLAYNEEATLCIDSANFPSGGDWLWLRSDFITIINPPTNTPLCFYVTDPNFEGVGDNSSVPYTYSLSQNYPNPFNPETVIKYSLERREKVNLSIYNILGQKVITLVDGERDAGENMVKWGGVDESGMSVASGIYFYKLTTDNFVETRKMALMR